MYKTTHMTNVTPLPPSIAREVAVRFLHDHVEMIELNPLVLRHQLTTPPPNATEEEQADWTWYEITDEISYLPGGYAKSEVTYKGGFYDLDDGLQTHVFAPAGVDIKGLWRVGGNMPGESPESSEPGVETPKDGLYLREDVELKCNIFLTSFVKRNLKKSHTKLVDDLVAKANDPEYLKGKEASISSTPSGTSLQKEAASGFAEGPSSPQSPTTAIKRVSAQSDEACACQGSSHHVMCSNYRYTPAFSGQWSRDTALNRSRDDPIGLGTNSDYASADRIPGMTHNRTPSMQQRQELDKDKPLPAEPPENDGQPRYSSPHAFGKPTELP
ncbi:hypothetical protein B0A50_02480 [Salinomyces thailandicus]|uniref:DUF7053 domain-containing protein n=1 Tax=Salinomyces thailandicus TaxID=706561 RepID=A0A4U0U6E2_9PEZI|nr:hypothetical protein B0A50_02480 [Salinomyces thailandica]